MDEMIIETISNLSETNDVLLCLFRKDGTIIRLFSNENAERWPREALLSLLKDADFTDHPVFLKIMKPCLSLGVLKLEGGCYLLVGPVPQRYISWEELYRYYGKNTDYEVLRSLFQRLSKRTQMDMRSFCALISLAAQLFCHRFYKTTEIVNLFELPAASAPVRKQLLRNNAVSQINLGDTLLFENMLCSAVSGGSPALIEEAFEFISDKHSLLDPIVPFEHSRLYLASLISQISRAAIRGGMDFNDAINKLIPYDLMIIRETKYENLFRILHIAVHDYCTAVSARTNAAITSELVQQCKSFIAQNINEKLSLQTLAAYCNVSPRTITRHFRQTLDMTVPAYIRREKLRESCFLLRNSEKSLSEISFQLGFSSQSYFTNCFEKEFGCTPLQYRTRRQP